MGSSMNLAFVICGDNFWMMLELRAGRIRSRKKVHAF